MAVRRITPEEARALMDEGYVYVDVRSIPEFEKGHPAGAYNVPLLNLGPAGMTPNPEFASVMDKSFPRDAKLIIGCKMGGRSAQASQLLESMGYTSLVDQKGGFEGQPGNPGWVPVGLPVAAQPEPGRAYEALLAKAR